MPDRPPPLQANTLKVIPRAWGFFTITFYASDAAVVKQAAIRLIICRNLTGPSRICLF
jgi:hypothetical protein